MRFFIALEIPKENLPSFQAIQDRLHTLLPQARLTNLEKIHLTLAFVGEQPEELKGKLIELIRNSVKNTPPFAVTPAYIDGFPNIHEPQVLWIGTKGDIDKILLIAKRITEGLEDLNLPIDERRFIPHITIAKELTEAVTHTVLAEATQQWAHFEGEAAFRVESLTLVRQVSDNRWDDLAPIPLGVFLAPSHR